MLLAHVQLPAPASGGEQVAVREGGREGGKSFCVLTRSLFDLEGNCSQLLSAGSSKDVWNALEHSKIWRSQKLKLAKINNFFYTFKKKSF